jgi:hypothetical protein
MRMAVTNLAKFVPSWGGIVGGAAAFASTWALGKMAARYFEGGMKADPATLKRSFRAAEEEGLDVWALQANAIQSKQREIRQRLAALQIGLESGKLSRSDFEARVANLA